ncbi:chromate transporter [Mycoplasma buteonis]|uniref:chromate transporter n=1 Tax=Mycoplasma buteonis TaxID=171280 RepID=UPI00055CCBB0|nr:chromate transporter [Mycoplasma buteonis]
MIALLVSIPLIILISLIVFGGGQVFMPIFSWFWNLLAKNFGSQIDDNTINQVFTVSNSTPGVVSTKFAFFSGYLVANGEWWGYLAMFLTYLVFCLPAIGMMLLAMKYINKFEHNKMMQNLLIISKPLVAGIMIALSVQLLISILLPEFYFNKGITEYFGKVDLEQKPHSLAALFDITTPIGYLRKILLYVYVILAVIIAAVCVKFKKSLFIVIIINVVLSILMLGIIPHLVYGF